ncbi:hypothetical protein [Pantoea sp. KPR_PJ]|uniref:hypothetical protein n=1 Tax=Pantoea sp. KPR_PJ TaxID=2738375 RepID=UPI00352894C3
MKKSLLIVVSLLASSAALAAADDDSNIPQENVYASKLCHIVSSETQVGTADSYVQKMKSYTAMSKSSSAMNQPEFDEDIANEVANAWLQLGEEERGKLRTDEQQCEQTVMTQFQQED